MKFSAIICEFNPLHLGHAYLISQAAKISNNPVLCLMSGNFVQRGEPAILNKYTRAELAYNAGACGVLELPTVYATASAEYFALGAVKILNDLFCVSHLFFGVETEDPDALMEIFTKVLENKNFDTELQTFLQKGNSYKSACKLVIEKLYNKATADILTQPNNILAFLYCKAIRTLHSSIIPVAISRQGNKYNETLLTENFASASAIRNNLNNLQAIKPYVNKETFAALQNNTAPNMQTYSDLVLFNLRNIPTETLQHIQGISEGLPFALKKHCHTSTTIHELIEKVKSKRYTYFRLQRLLLHTLLETPNTILQNLLKNEQNYAKILCISKKYLPFCRKNKHFICITKHKDLQNLNDSCAESYALDKKASNIYSLLTREESNTDTRIGTLFKE